MIQINKGDAPQKLVEKEKTLVEDYKKKFDAEKEEYLTGNKSFDITDDYKMDIVKDTLLDKQNNKCCFSEAKFVGDYPHVEHFRPKKRVEILATGEKLFPGYYWLAYDWGNLFICKELINCSYKRNYFPLADESQRNRNHHDTFIEQSILIDPSKENPRDHIIFFEHEPKPLTSKGKQNIDMLGLRHPSFTEARRKRFKELRRLKEQVDIAAATGLNLNHQVIADNIEELKKSMEPTSEFSSMAIDLLQGWPHIQ